MNIKLTEKQAVALMWAIELTEASYEGWTNSEKGPETVRDLAILQRVYDKLTLPSQTA